MSRNPFATALRYVRQQRIEDKRAADLWHSLAAQAAEPIDDDAEDFGPLSHEERNRRWFGDA